MDATKPYEFIGFGATDATKPYEFIGFGAMDGTKPYKFIRFGAMDATKPYKFIGFGAMDATKPCEFIGFRVCLVGWRPPSSVFVGGGRSSYLFVWPEATYVWCTVRAPNGVLFRANRANRGVVGGVR